MAFRAAPISSGRIVPRVTIGRLTPFIPRGRLNTIAGYLRLPQPIQAPALMRLLQGTTLAIRPKIMARYEEAAAWMIAVD